MKKQESKIYLICLFLLMFIVGIYIYFEDASNMNSIMKNIGDDAIVFSKDSGFYDTELDVNLKIDIDVPIGAQIFYTLDGDDPTIESKQYKSSIKLELVENEIKVYPVRVIIYYNHGYSDVWQKTYVIGKNISDTFDLDVINITSSHKNLYDHYTGIMVRGITYDNNVANGMTGFIPGNYNNRTAEWIKNSNVVMFDSNGNVILEEKVGLGVLGNTSAQNDSKSLKIIADEIYGSKNNKLKLFLYADDTISNVSIQSKYKSLRLRSGSQDSVFSNIRSSIISKLANDSGFDCTTSKRIIVYLNGAFQGIYDMQQNYTESLLRDKFGLMEEEKIEKYETSETGVLKEANISQYFKTDLNIEKNRIELEKHVDMDNFLQYYAINILANNTDWPQNNIMMWRYIGTYDDSNKYSDGRYRFIITDVDIVYYNSAGEVFFEGSNQDIFISIMENEYKATNSVIRNVFNSKIYRDKFIIIIQNLLKTSFNYKNIEKIVDSESNKIQKANHFFYDDKFITNADRAINNLKIAAQLKNDTIENNMEEYFDLDEKYNFSIKNAKGINVYWVNETLYENEKYENEYYDDVNFDLIIEEYPGYTYEYAIINGKKVYNNVIKISEDLIEDNEIKIEIVSKKANKQKLLISEISAKSDSDWIKLTNISENDLNLKNYYLSDTDKNLKKYQLPNIILKSNESIMINGKKNFYSIGDYICNFNLNENEILYLYNLSNDKVEDKLSVPVMDKYESYGRYLNSNVYKFFDNKNNQRH